MKLRKALALAALTGSLMAGGMTQANAGQDHGPGRSTSISGSYIVRWNPCEVIQWSADVRHAPGSNVRALAEIKRQVAFISQASGLKFEYVGAVKSGPTTDAYSTSDLTITWATYTSGGSVGRTMAHWDNREINKAKVVLNTRLFRSERYTRFVIKHELLHSIGVGHSHDKRDIMYGAHGNGLLRLGAGDKVALQHVGAKAGCL
jgi:hypothetical protein